MARGKRRGGSLGSMTVAELQKEISKRHRSVGRLERKRGRLLSKLAALDAQIAASGGSAGGRGGAGRRSIAPRQKNKLTLVEALVGVLKTRTMGVTEVAEFVRKNGYKSAAPSFRTIVNQALIASGKFKRVGRGQYTVK